MKRKQSLYATVSFLGALVLSVGVQAAQGKLYKEVKGWKIHSYTSSESSSMPSCSAVHFKDHADALRIERFQEGYLYGINGLSRERQGPRKTMSFWFDGDKGSEIGGDAEFIKDAAFPYDDWLSFFHPFNERHTLIQAISQKNEIGFAFRMPGNRTGNDIVETNFKLTGSAAAILALDECFNVANGKKKLASGPSNASAKLPGTSDCPDGGPRLSDSGICQGRGVNYLDIKDGNPPMLMQGCQWKLNDAAMPGGDYLLYLAASCGQHTTKLEFAGGAGTAKISIARSGMDNGNPGWDFITVANVDQNNPTASIQQFVRNAMDDKAAAAGCVIKRVGDGGYPSDALAVNNQALQNKFAADGPPGPVCGPFGEQGDSTSYWRVLGDLGFYFDLGQDAYQDIDPRSLTILSASELPK